MAGRSTPGSTPRTNIPMAMAAPVLPAETKAPASPSLTSSAATRSDESRLRRTACEADSPMPITWDAWWIVRGRPEARRRGGSGSVGGRAAPGGLDAHETDAELCPFDREDLPPLVVAAVGADPVGQLGLPALGAGRERGGRKRVVGGGRPFGVGGVGGVEVRL